MGGFQALGCGLALRNRILALPGSVMAPRSSKGGQLHDRQPPSGTHPFRSRFVAPRVVLQPLETHLSLSPHAVSVDSIRLFGMHRHRMVRVRAHGSENVYPLTVVAAGKQHPSAETGVRREARWPEPGAFVRALWIGWSGFIGGRSLPVTQIEALSTPQGHHQKRAL